MNAAVCCCSFFLFCLYGFLEIRAQLWPWRLQKWGGGGVCGDCVCFSERVVAERLQLETPDKANLGPNLPPAITPTDRMIQHSCQTPPSRERARRRQAVISLDPCVCVFFLFCACVNLHERINWHLYGFPSVREGDCASARLFVCGRMKVESIHLLFQTRRKMESDGRDQEAAESPVIFYPD